MKKHKIIHAFLFISLILFFGCNTSTPSQENIIRITDSDFQPDTVTITQGTTVTWVNNDTKPHWVASNPHPTHDAYPEKGGCVGSRFDSCGSIAPGENFSFTFDYKGSWNYHDHLRPTFFKGTIVVQ